MVGVSKRLAEVLADDLTRADNGLKGAGEGEPPAVTDETDTPALNAEPSAKPILTKTQAGAALGRPALDLLLGALLCAATLLSGRAQPPGPREAGIWLYGEALPTGAIDHTDAALVMRALALAQAADAVPVNLLQDLAADTEQFVRRVVGRA